MSYVLHLWDAQEAEAPADVRGALAIVERLRARQPARRAFPGLARRLTARYPCITSEAARAISELEWAWSDGPLDGGTDSAVYSIGLSTAMVDEVLPFVVREANALGIAVLDPQGGQAHLPGGQVLGHGAQPQWQPDQEFDPADRDLARIVLERLTPLLAPQGFKPRRSDFSFKQKFPGGWHVINLVVRGYDVGFLIDSRLDAVAELTALIFPPVPPENPANWWTTMLSDKQWAGPAHGSSGYAAMGQGQIDGMLAQFEGVWNAKLGPALAQYRDVQGLDRLLNGPPLGQSLFYKGKYHLTANILAAYLADNPRLPAICAEVLAHVESGGTSNAMHIELTRACVEYVRSHPRPAAAV